MEAIVRQRVGQDLFREPLLEHWERRCAVTGLDMPELIRASHAKPWKDATDAERDALAQRVREMRLELDSLRYEEYVAKLEEGGAIVEELITGEEMVSPSAQLRVTPLGEVELLSTHDQLLGGPTGQTYFGCRFPANPGYGPAIMSEAAKVGRRLAREGV
ncbi:MAG: hypothetical protein H0X65_22235, partial [Gemmatimonadetes bacterium]|nr:hypothetical protein [Gemmatimonadota bacterium]